MSSADFKALKVVPPILEGITSELSYGVLQGGESVVFYPYPSTSADITGMTFNCNIPSLNTIVDRRVLWNAEVQLVLTGVAPSGKFLINYGLTDSLAAFPLHQLMSTITSQINGNTVSVNSQQLVASILRLHDSRQLFAYNSSTPTMYDQYANYTNAISASNNPLGAFNNSADYDLLPRGSFSLIAVDTSPNPANGTYNVPVSTGAAQTLYIRFRSIEPMLCLSPFIMADYSSCKQGFFGINTINFNMVTGPTNRVWRSSNNYLTSISLYQPAAFANVAINTQLITPKPSLLIESKNIVPYYNIINYNSNNFSAVASGASATFQSNNLNLNNIPDMFVIFVRKTLANQTYNDPDYFMAINNISCNFNNNSGLISSATQQQLFQMSRENGYNGSWQEFSGYANTFSAGSALNIIPTSGSVLLVKPAKDLQVTAGYLSPGSLGNFNFQVNVNFTNQTANAYAAGQLELVILTVSSGLFVNNNGTSGSYIGILDAQTVLNVQEQEAYGQLELQRMVGGGLSGGSIFSSLASIGKSLLPKIPSIAKNILGQINNPYAQVGSQLLGSLGAAKGYGMQASGMSGGMMEACGQSGGKKKKNMKLLSMM